MLNIVVLTTLIQVVGDLVCCFLSLTCAFSKNQRYKAFFIINSIAFFVIAIGDVYYNYLFRILQRDIKMSVDLVVSLTIFTFQVSQVYNWYLLVKQQKAVIVSLDNLAYLLFSIIVISVLVYNFWTGYSPSTLASWYQSINASLNMAVWLFAIICLARARSLSIILLTLGCLLIVSSALTTDCLFMFAMDKVATARSIHIIWVLGVIAMAIGFFYCLKNKEFKFCPSDSIQARCCSWLSITSLVIVVIGFCFLEFFNLELNLNIGSILWCVPIVLVFTMITSVLLGNWFSNMILLPVTHFLQRIEAFNLGQKIKEENSNAAMLYEFKVLGNFINSSFKKLSTQLEREIKIAAQVAHDIRSPLTALEVVIKRLPEIEESKRILLRDAINHIRDITNNLEKTNPSDNNHEHTSIINIAILLEYVISECRAAFMSQSIEIIHDFEPDCYKLFIDVPPSEMKRVLTNIINNACEAVLPKDGIVNVCIKRENGYIIITIDDNGPGISKEIQDSLFTRGVTTKNKGSGLGLYYARESLANWNGTIDLISHTTGGTSAYIKLPLKNPPSWFISSLSFANNSTVICVDDSISIWHAWQERFTTVDGNIDLRYCSSKEELLYEIEKRNEKPCTYLVDYEFSGSGYTGLELVDIIQSLGIPNNRVFLVTSRSNEMEVQNLCKSREIYMIPKFFALKMDLQIIKSPPKNIILLPPCDYQKIHFKYLSSIKDILFYQEQNNFLADITLFDHSINISINVHFINGFLEKMLKKHKLTMNIFHDLDHLPYVSANKFLTGELYDE